MNEKSLIIIPTYNELENIRKMIPDILGRYDDVDILIVDDNSPDGTGVFIEQLTRESDRIKLIKRQGKMGLGTAYIQGFKYALQNQYDYIFEMDADFSHDPKEIGNFLNTIKNYDLVLGSRYKKGFKITEIPIIFIDRHQGTSKMSKKIVREAVLMVWKLRIRNTFGIL